jgi:hypothetical protein
MSKLRMATRGPERRSDALAPRSAVGGTSASIAQVQIDNLHRSLAATVGTFPQITKTRRKGLGT